MSRIVLHIISGDVWGGAEAQLALQLPAIAASGTAVRALLFNRGETHDRLQSAGIACDVADERLGARRFFDAALAAIRAADPAVLVAHGYKEAFIASCCSWKLGLPWIAMFHGTTERYPGWKGLKAGVYSSIHRALARRFAARIITVSNTMARELALEGHPRHAVIYNTSRLPSNGDTAGQSEALLPERPAVVVVGRLVPVKRADLAIDAVLRVNERLDPPAHLYFVGDGPEREALEARSAVHPGGARIHFLGFRRDALSLIAAADLLLLSSDSEGVPTVLLEAASVGTPLATTDVGGIAEVLALLPEYPAATAPPGDVEALANAIEARLRSGKAAGHEATRQSLGRMFSPEIAAESHRALYDAVLRERGDHL